MTPFSWNNPYAWPRKPLLAQNVVATSQPLAAQAGLQMLAAGGNAVDAILATAITLSLVEPVSNGIGSDAYALVWDGRKLHGLNASGRSPAAWTPDYFRGKSGNAGARLGHGHRAGRRVGLGRAARQVRQAAVRASCSSRRSATAAKASWSRRPSPGSGQVPGRQAQGPARLRRGVPAGRTRAARRRKIRVQETCRGPGKDRGDARARHSIAASSPQSSRLRAKKHGGALRASDLAAHRPDWVKPLEMDYRGYTLHEIPPNGQGIAALIALGILEQLRPALASRWTAPTACTCRSRR